jgi:26S proteasome regulatory subunit (ATPase 3-interacting protein)
LSALRGEDDGQEKMAPMTDEEMKKIDDEFAFWRKHWVDRRKIYKE